MIPVETDDDRLANVLLAAKRAHDFGRGNADDRLAHVAPLIEALGQARDQRRNYRRLVHELLATVREIPIMPRDAHMGSEPLVYRWVVAKPADFDKVVMRLRAEFPETL
jgi:hypothetical protein